MGLFRDLGERVERFKRQAEDASRAQAEFGCADCGEPIYTDRETCPHCGSEAVVARVDNSEGSGESEALDGAGDAIEEDEDEPPGEEPVNETESPADPEN